VLVAVNKKLQILAYEVSRSKKQEARGKKQEAEAGSENKS
jgi:hypothetical protein